MVRKRKTKKWKNTEQVLKMILFKINKLIFKNFYFKVIFKMKNIIKGFN
jgi:hypothetical protein